MIPPGQTARQETCLAAVQMNWSGTLKVRPKKVKIRDSPVHVFTFFHVRLVRTPIISTGNSRSVLDDDL